MPGLGAIGAPRRPRQRPPTAGRLRNNVSPRLIDGGHEKGRPGNRTALMLASVWRRLSRLLHPLQEPHRLKAQLVVKFEEDGLQGLDLQLKEAVERLGRIAEAARVRRDDAE